MAYTVQTWVDGNPAYPASAARLAHLEEGVNAAHNGVADVEAARAAHNALKTGVHGIPTMANGQGLLWNGSAWVATDLATQAEINAHAAAAVGAHGIPGTVATGRSLVRTATAWAASDLQRGVSVKDYGAVGDGTTNDTTAIQAAVDAAGSRPVFLSEGGHAISAPIDLHANSKLVGWHVPSWMPGTNRTTFLAPYAGSNFTNSAYITIRDKRLSGAATAPGGGLIQGICVY